MAIALWPHQLWYRLLSAETTHTCGQHHETYRLTCPNFRMRGGVFFLFLAQSFFTQLWQFYISFRR